MLDSMKKFLLVILACMLSVVLYAQNNVTKFLGIPVDGTKRTMIQKLKAKGFTYNSVDDCLEGQFNGKSVHLFVLTNNNKVWRIAVMEQVFLDEGQIKIRYNTLCEQFGNNPKYFPIDANRLSEDEDISYEMSIHSKSYQATYGQLPHDNDLTKRLVWFAILETKGEYRIAIFYDNGFNQANGEDL